MDLGYATVMRVFITDASSYIGAAIKVALESSGHDVRSLATPSLLRENTLRQTLLQCDTLVHTYGVREPSADKELPLRTNVEVTDAILTAVSDSHVRTVVLVSSADATLCMADRIFWDEKRRLAAGYMSTYVKSLHVAEDLVLARGNNALGSIVLRPGRVWGPNEPWLQALLSEQLRRGARGLSLPAGGRKMAALTHIDHLAAAVVATVERGEKLWGRYYVCDAQATTWREWFSALSQIWPELKPQTGLPRTMALLAARTGYSKSPILSSTERAVEFSYHSHFNCSLAIKDLGYEAPIDLQSGVNTLKAA